jgi:L-asparaginase/Glu-tRNA(Gln) amidotransferase subunit D
MLNHKGVKRLNLTATNNTAIVKPVTLLGVFVSAASATPTLKLADTGGTIANTFTPTAGTMYWFPCDTIGTLTVTISGTVDATVFYKP